MIKKYLIFLISIYCTVSCMEVNDFLDIDVSAIATAQVIEYDKEGNYLKVKLSKESSDLVEAFLQANLQLKVEDVIGNSVLIKSIKNDGEITVLHLEHQFNHEFASSKTINILTKVSDKETIDRLLLIEDQHTTTSEQSVIYDLVDDAAYYMHDAYENTVEPEESQLSQIDVDQTEEKGETTESDNEYLTNEEDVNEGSVPRTENLDIEYILVEDEEQEKKSDEVENENLISQITSSEKKNVAEKRIEKKKKSYTCGYEGCGKSFAEASNLKVHKRIHTREKPYICDYEGCGKSFTQASNLKVHKRIHTREKPYTCDYEGCGKSFSQVHHLKNHKSVHTGEKPYTCDYEGCGKSFSIASNLKVHKRIHTREKPYTCGYEGCGKSFTQASNLKRHKSVHTGEKPYTCDCEGCDKSFSDLSTLRRHKQTHDKRKADTELENKTELKKRRKK